VNEYDAYIADAESRKLFDDSEAFHKRLLEKPNLTTNAAARRAYLDHMRGVVASRIGEDDLSRGHSVSWTLFNIWTLRRHMYELTVVRMRSDEDKRALADYERERYGSPGMPSVDYLLGADPDKADPVDLFERVLGRKEDSSPLFRKPPRKAKDLPSHLQRSVTWVRIDNPAAPWTADVDGERWEIRINQFPDEPLFTLFVNGHSVTDFEDWPKKWKRPGT